MELKTEEVTELKKRVGDYDKLKREMATPKQKLHKANQLRVAPVKNNKENAPPPTPTRKQAKTPLRMTRPPKYNEPQVR